MKWEIVIYKERIETLLFTLNEMGDGYLHRKNSEIVKLLIFTMNIEMGIHSRGSYLH